MTHEVNFILALWLLVAAGTSLLAADKKRSIAHWAAAGLLFGPFALLAAAALPRGEDDASAHQI